MRTRLGIIFGGRSGEHDISIRSARTVIEQADADRYEIVLLAIDQAGKWLSPARSIELLADATQSAFRERFGEASESEIALTSGSSGSGLVRTIDLGELLALDVVFPVLHGTFGEDGTIQGALEMANLPYVGCGVLASSCGMDKAFMKTLFRDAGLPMCNYLWFLRDEWTADRETVARQVESKLKFPCFVKPANLGSSVGVSRAVDRESLNIAIALAAEYDRKIIVEEAVEMRELECAVLGNDDPQASLPGEYLIRDDARKFLDYTEKYEGTGGNEFVTPAPISDELAERVRQMAVTAFKAIDGSGLARVDFFLRHDTGALLVNEINTMPGLTNASGFPKMWQATGKPFTQVIDELVALALERHQDKARNRTDR